MATAFDDVSVPYYLRPDEEDDDGSFASSISSGFRTNPDGDAAPTPAAAPVAGGGVVPVRSSGEATPAYTAPTPPTIDRSNLNQWENRKAADSQVSTGKAVQPKWWERGLGGLAAGAMAFGHVPGALEAGQNVTNRRFNQAESERAGRLAQDQQQIQAAQNDINSQNQAWEQKRQGFNDQIRAENANALQDQRRALEQQRLQAIAPGSEAPDDPANPLGPWHATTVEGKRIATTVPDKWLKTPAGIAAQRDADITTMKSKGVKFTPEDEKFYRANGKLHEPVPRTTIHVPSAESEAYHDSLLAWQRQNPGKKPSVEDLREIRSASQGKSESTGKGRGPNGRGTPGQFKELDRQTASLYAKAEADYKAAVSTATTQEEKDSALADLNAEKTRIGIDHSSQLRDLGGIPAEDSQQPQAQNNPAAQPPPQQRPTPQAAAQRPAAQPQQAQPQQTASLPPQAASRLKEGIRTTFGNHSVWTLRNGKPFQIK